MKLLTTQLQNQNPLDPLDTNQFTQQLVEFAQVEQQMKSNDQLTTLISLQESAQSTEAVGYIGATVVVDGSTAKLSSGSASWDLSSSKPATATITVKSSTGETAYTKSMSVNAGTQTFTWDGKGTNGSQWADGDYTISVSAVDASGQSTTVSVEHQGTVDSVDSTQQPPVLSIDGQNYALSKIKRIVKK